jgi:hypothetical protein
VQLASIQLTGDPVRVMAGEPATVLADGVLGVDVRGTSVEGTPHVVVQVLLDDDRPDFDPDLYDAPVVVDVLGSDAVMLASELADHDAFRRALRDERDEGRPERRGVLLLTDGELPERWVRLAFLPLPLDSTDGATLVLRRAATDELVAGVERAYADGAIGDAERTAALTTIEHLHPRRP